MEARELHRALGDAARAFPPASDGTRSHAPWLVLVRLPDGTLCEIVAVRPGPLEVVLDAEPRRAP